eukprot:c23959_g4_i1 orf=72-248(-)
MLVPPKMLKAKVDFMKNQIKIPHCYYYLFILRKNSRLTVFEMQIIQTGEIKGTLTEHK